jgi:formiminotetrahydrofolate cyclodeaminase
MGAGLVAMVAGIGWRKGSDPSPGSALDRAAVEAQALKERLLGLAVDDEEAYGAVVAAHAMPSKTEGEKRERDARIAAAMARCVDVPLQVMEASARGLDLLRTIMRDCPASVASDTAGALQGLRSGAATARAVVLVNLKEGALQAGEAKAASERLRAARASIDALGAEIEAHVAGLL